MRIPLVRPNMPKLEEVQQYYQLAEKHGQYTNFGLCYDIAVTKLQKVYPGSHPVLVNNGTTAIQVALQATVGRGSRVALPTFTFAATLNAVVAAGMIPVLFDVDPETWQIDKKLLLDNKSKYDAVVVVSPFGYAVDVADYDRILGEINRPIVYDFAPAWGHPLSKLYPTTFSFHATKTLPIGEGGAIMFPHEVNAEKGRQLINFDLYDRHIRTMYGMNGKLDELHCAVLCAQLDKNEEHLVGSRLCSRLVRMLSTNFLARASNHLQLPVVQIRAHKLPKVMAALKENDIACKEYYKPRMHETFPELPFICGNRVNAPTTTLGLPRPASVDEMVKIHDIIMRVLNE